MRKWVSERARGREGVREWETMEVRVDGTAANILSNQWNFSFAARRVLVVVVGAMALSLHHHQYLKLWSCLLWSWQLPYIHTHTLTHTTLIHFQLSSATPKLKQYTVSVDRSLVYWFAHLAAGLVSVQSVAPTVGHSSHTQWQLKCLGLFNNFALWPPCWLD